MFIITNLVHRESDLPVRSSSVAGFPFFERLLLQSFVPLPPLASFDPLPLVSSSPSPDLDGEILVMRHLARDEFAGTSK